MSINSLPLFADENEKTTSDPSLLASLNKQQLEAVERTEGPLLVIAGAGSGKTRVIAYRIANVISKGLAKPSQILAVTFTNKAAGEMKERVISLTGIEPGKLWVGTFHSICVRMLRMHGHLLGYTNNFVIYDDDDSQALVKSILKNENCDNDKSTVRAMLYEINQAKIKLLGPNEAHSIDETFVKVYEQYTFRLKANNAMDFSDLIMQAVILLREHDSVREFYQKKFKYVLIDEYQDTNLSQFEWIKLLSSKHRNICVVGDDDQSIYGWRGADIRNILSFERDFDDARTIRLEQNYRSTKLILKAANHVIEKNSGRHPKKLWTDNAEGERIQLFAARDEIDEADAIARAIRDYCAEDGYSPKDIAVFYRTHAQSRALEMAFSQRQIAYQIIGGTRFYERKEIKDLVAYLRFLVNPADSVALGRIINVPPRGIGAITLLKLQNAAESVGTVWDVIQKAPGIEGLGKKGNEALADFARLVLKYKDKLENGTIPSQLLIDLIEDIKYWDYLKEFEEKSQSEIDRVENVEELVSAIATYEELAEEEPSAAGFLQEIALYSDTDKPEDEQGRVALMTFHSAKGLEFPIVFMTGLEQGLFPSQRASLEDNYKERLEEERRLCYVGMTRAKEQLCMSLARTRRIYGQHVNNDPSEFLLEIPGEMIQGNTEMLFTAKADRYNNYGIRGEKGKRNSNLGDFRDEPSEELSEEERFMETTMTGQDFFMPEVGDKVTHPKWGIGTVIYKSGVDEKTKVIVLFPDEGRKTLMVKYAKLDRA